MRPQHPETHEQQRCAISGPWTTGSCSTDQFPADALGRVAYLGLGKQNLGTQLRWLCPKARLTEELRVATAPALLVQKHLWRLLPPLHSHVPLGFCGPGKGGLHPWGSRCGSGLLWSGVKENGWKERALRSTRGRQGLSCPRALRLLPPRVSASGPGWPSGTGAPLFCAVGVMCQVSFSHQLLPAHGPPAPTQHPTVIVPAPPLPSHHVTVVTMGPSSVINTISTSRQNLDTIVQVRAGRSSS